MVIIKLKGGLGNQMFQYAHGRSFAKSKGQELFLDLSWYSNSNIAQMETARPYDLKNFNITESIATPENLALFHRDLTFTQKVIRKLKVKLLPSAFSQEYDSVQTSADKQHFYLDGFWQSEDQFKEAADEVRQEFTLKNGFGLIAQETARQMKENSVSLHMRNTDYLSPSNTSLFARRTPEYYRRAAALIAQKVKDPHFFVFSDDIEIAKSELQLEYPMTFVSHPSIKDYEEMLLMSSCAHNIIANSSFSWWSAWLNQNPQKTVIAPEHWYKNPDLDPKGLIPKSWIKI